VVVLQEAAEQSEGELNVTCLRLKGELAQSSLQAAEVQAQVSCLGKECQGLQQVAARCLAVV
jgi:hypothetical protein